MQTTVQWVKDISKTTGVKQDTIKVILDDLVDAIITALKAGDKIRTPLGIFSVSNVPESKRNVNLPKYQGIKVIPAYKRPRLAFSKIVKEDLNPHLVK